MKELTLISCKVYNYILKSGEPPKSWCKAIITVLHKEGKGPLQCTSYRPISLLCVECKILLSIPPLIQCLCNYGSVSGYKVNENTSEAMMISGVWPTQLNENISFCWSGQGLRYLGAVLTHIPTQLFNASYNKFNQQIKKDIIQWEILPLLLIGRVETVKMNLLPRRLFSIPISSCKSVHFHL